MLLAEVVDIVWNSPPLSVPIAPDADDIEDPFMLPSPPELLLLFLIKPDDLISEIIVLVLTPPAIDDVMPDKPFTPLPLVPAPLPPPLAPAITKLWPPTFIIVEGGDVTDDVGVEVVELFPSEVFEESAPPEFVEGVFVAVGIIATMPGSGTPPTMPCDVPMPPIPPLPPIIPEDANALLLPELYPCC